MNWEVDDGDGRSKTIYIRSFFFAKKKQTHNNLYEIANIFNSKIDSLFYLV